MKQPITWIVTADGSRARFHRLAEDQRSIVATEQKLEWARARGRSADLMTDRAGHGSARSAPDAGAGNQPGAAVVPETDPKEVEKERFDDRVAEAMRAALAAGRVERFVVAAEPRTLGRLRDALPDRVRERVIAEIDKDYTEADPAQLVERVRPYLPSAVG